MSGGRRFSLSSPDWGQDHLSLDAIVAYVDDELTAGAHDRAQAHVASCPECHAEVRAQLQARSVLRSASGPCLPSSLLRSLRSIPVEAELPPPPPGLGITADGQFVLLRDAPATPGPATPQAQHSHGDDRTARPVGLGPDHGPAPRRFSRRARFGAVSGLAVGALAVGALTVPGAAGPEEPGVLRGPVLNAPAQARLSAAPGLPVLGPAITARSGPAFASPAVAGSATGSGSAAASVTDPAPVEAQSADEASGAAVDTRLREQLDRRPVAFVQGNP